MSSNNVVVFGTGGFGRRYLNEIKENVKVLAIFDNDSSKWGKYFFGHKIAEPASIVNIAYDKVIVAINDVSDEGKAAISIIINQLYSYGVERSKIYIPSFGLLAGNSVHDKRVNFLQELSKIIQEYNIEGAAAECGVYRGHFASVINEYLPDRKLYLFDTFEGFSQNDVDKETQEFKNTEIGKTLNEWSVKTSDEIALMRCLHQENVIIKKGYVPETFAGLEDEKFCFVNIDLDLYAPILSALFFFSPRMNKNGGVILVHDYYNAAFPGCRKAVSEFINEYSNPVTLLPIEDSCSIAIIVHN
jgi:hypothetical protein